MYHIVRYHFGPLEDQASDFGTIELEVALKVAKSAVDVLCTERQPIGIRADYILYHIYSKLMRPHISYSRAKIVHILLEDIRIPRDEFTYVIGGHAAIVQEPYVRFHLVVEIEAQDVLHHIRLGLELIQFHAELNQLLNGARLIRVLGEREGWREVRSDVGQILVASVQGFR